MLVQSFDRVSRLARGYRPEQVDAFLARVEGLEVDAAQVRTAGFDLVRGGYRIEVVDDALDRVEDELVGAERDRARSDLGESRFLTSVTNQAQVLRVRLARQHGDRFARAAAWSSGYEVADVDVLCDQLSDYLDGDQAVTVDAVRGAVFRTRRGSRGYDEGAVDAFLDRVVAVISTVR